MKRLTLRIKRKFAKLQRQKHHPFIHKVHETHGISRKTLFYMKEYGRKSHVANVIIKESLLVLIVSFLIAIVGGVTLESIKSQFVFFLPLLILLPALNDMVGDYSMILVARASTLLFMKSVGNWWSSEDIRKIFRNIILVAILSAIYIGLASSLIAYLKGFSLTLSSVMKILEISLITTLVMVIIVTIVASFGVFYVYKRKEDPNNLVMPIMTSIADLGTILVFTLMVRLIF